MQHGCPRPLLVRRVGLLLAVGALLLTLARCDWSTEPVEEQSLVVETFLETGQPPPTVILRRTRPLRSAGDRVADAASGGAVRLSVGGEPVPYDETETPGRYAAAAGDTRVPPRTAWQLRVRWNGTQAQARGVTPPPIGIAEVCAEVPADPVRAVQVDSVRRDSLDIPADQGYLYPIEVRVRWDAPLPSEQADSTYWVRAQLHPDADPFPSEVVDFFLEPAEIRREDQFVRTEGRLQWQGVYAVPVDSSDAPLPPHSLTTSLVRGDTAFASFAQTRTDPDRREPISNVNGALGVALGVSVDSLSRTIEPEGGACVARP